MKKKESQASEVDGNGDEETKPVKTKKKKTQKTASKAQLLETAVSTEELQDIPQRIFFFFFLFSKIKISNNE